MDDDKLTEDILSMLTQAKGKITKTDLIDGLRGTGWPTPASGRRWRGLPSSWEMLSLVEKQGFTVTHTYKGKCITKTYITL